MIALLPLRAVAGDVMSIGMTAPAAVHGQAMVMPDCDMHLAHAGAQPADADQSAPSADAQCASCALCYPVASASAFGLGLSFDSPEARPASGDARFVSAAIGRDLRPPSL
jgi:hypothetical protein